MSPSAFDLLAAEGLDALANISEPEKSVNILSAWDTVDTHGLNFEYYFYHKVKLDPS